MDDRKNKAVEKARRVLEKLLARRPEFTGKVVLNFHEGSIGDRVEVAETLKIE